MAIVRMKKLSLLAARSQKDELLRELMLLGCVELREQSEILDAMEGSELVSHEIGDAADWRSKKALLDNAIVLLKRYAPQKSPLLAPKPEMAESVFLDESELDKAVDVSKEIISLDDMIKSYNAEESKLQLAMDTLSPWRNYELPLENNGTKHVAVALGTAPASVDMAALSVELSSVVEEAQLFEIGEDKSLHYFSVFYLREGEEAVLQLLREHGFTVPTFGALSGTVRENLNDLEAALEKLKQERALCQAQIASNSTHRELLKLCSDRFNILAERAAVSELLLKTDNVLVMGGWYTAENEAELVALLEKYECAYELRDPVEDEYPAVPVKLKNNKLTEGLNMVTEMYSLPMYGSVDPNPIIAPFFLLFYGIMMADMGYGLVMMLAGWLIMSKMRPKQGFLRYFGLMMIEGGIATFIIGILTGGFFGDAPYYVVHLINPESTWAGLPVIIDPLNDTVMVLIGALALGLIHLCYGMAVSFYMKTRDGDLIGALCEEGGTWALFLGAGLTLLGIGGSIPLYVGLACYAVGKMHSGKGIIGKVMAVFSGIYNDATGWFGDILSYARLMALMLAGGVTAQVFNRLGAMPGNIFVFLIICLVGNALNFALNLLGCYVHDLRLQCLELFNKFYVAGGKAFAPLKIRSKYYDVIK